MGKVIEKDSQVGGNQYLFIDGQPIPNVQSFSPSYRIPSTDLIYLGEKTSPPIPNGNYEGQIAISAFLLSQDSFIQFTGNNCVNGYLIGNLENKLTNNFGFISGYMTSYSQSYSTSQVPTVNVQFQTFNGLGFMTEPISEQIATEINSLSYTSNKIFQESSLGCADITVNSTANCPLLSYSINISTPRIPVFPINKKVPSHVFLGSQAGVTLELTMLKSDYQLFNNSKYPSSTPTDNVLINLKNKQGDTYNSYFFSTMMLDTSSLNATPDNQDQVSLTYRKRIV